MRRQQLIRCIALLLILPRLQTPAFSDEIRNCKFAVKARCVSGEARVTMAGGVPARVEIDVRWCAAQRGQPDYGCTIDSSRGDQDSAWSDEAGATVITNKLPWSPAQPDRVKVTLGKEVAVDLSEAQSLGRCGAGAELPRTIVIPAGKQACRVTLSEP